MAKPHWESPVEYIYVGYFSKFLLLEKVSFRDTWIYVVLLPLTHNSKTQTALKRGSFCVNNHVGRKVCSDLNSFRVKTWPELHEPVSGSVHCIHGVNVNALL